MQKHNRNLYNNLLQLSRNLFFYTKIELSDTFETRIYLMFFHFSIIMKVCKNKGYKFNQNEYDFLFHNIENNLRELGLGDVSVNKKMKELNKILYDILLKIEINDKTNFVSKSNSKLFITYFSSLDDQNKKKLKLFNTYFMHFFNFCFELSSDNMIEDIKNFKL